MRNLILVLFIFGLTGFSCYFSTTDNESATPSQNGIFFLFLDDISEIAMFKVAMTSENDTSSFYQKAYGDSLFASAKGGNEYSIVLDGFDSEGLRRATWSGEVKTEDGAPVHVKVEFETVTPQSPQAPAGLQAEMDNESVKLKWQPSEKAAGYIIYRATEFTEDETGDYIDSCKTTIYTDNSVEDEQQYYYRISSYNKAGESELSEPVAIITDFSGASLEVPSAPTGVSATAISSTEIEILWDKSTGATEYAVYRKPSSSGTYELIATVYGLTHTDSNLTPSTKMYYAVAAINSAGESPKSSSVNATTAGEPPNAPTGLFAEGASESGILMRWNAETDALFYLVYKCFSEQGTYSRADSTTDTFSMINGLSADTEVFLKVKAGNTGGLSDFSDVVSAQTLPEADQPPNSPEGVTAEAIFSSAIRITWESSSGASYYTVYRGTSESDINDSIAAISGLSFTDSGLSQSETYYYKVSASNSAGESQKSSAVSASTGETLSAPQNVTAEAVSSSNVQLSWSNVAGAEGYRIMRSTSEAGSFSEAGESSTTSYTDNNLTAGNTYFYKIIAIKGDNESSPSQIVEVTLTAAVPATPSNVSATAISSTEISVSFNTVSGASGYRIYRSSGESGTFNLLSEVGGSPYSNTGLTAGSTWYYKVSAYNDGGESQQSATVSATTTQEQTIHNYCVIDPGTCRDCSRCIGVCPKGAISDAGSYKTIDKSKCDADGCQLCKQACDSYAGAISVQQEILSKIRKLFK